MINIIWEFQVNPLHIATFEQIYGPSGDWVLLFNRSADYHETILLKDRFFLGKYLTIDRWNNLDAFESFRTQNDQAYKDLDQLCEKLTMTEKKIGIFEDLA